MSLFYQIDWKSIFIPSSLQLGEIFVRGSIVYLSLFFVFRVLRREAGSVGVSDLLLVVLVADAAQNAMANEYKTVTEGLALVLTLAFWDHFIDWLGYRYPSLQRLLRPAPILLIKDGEFQRRNMRQEMITEEELMGKLREQGVGHVKEVKQSYMEDDGTISIIKK